MPQCWVIQVQEVAGGQAEVRGDLVGAQRVGGLVADRGGEPGDACVGAEVRARDRAVVEQIRVDDGCAAQLDQFALAPVAEAESSFRGGHLVGDHGRGRTRRVDEQHQNPPLRGNDTVGSAGWREGAAGANQTGGGVHDQRPVQADGEHGDRRRVRIGPQVRSDIPDVPWSCPRGRHPHGTADLRMDVAAHPYQGIDVSPGAPRTVIRISVSVVVIRDRRFPEGGDREARSWRVYSCRGERRTASASPLSPSLLTRRGDEWGSVA